MSICVNVSLGKVNFPEICRVDLSKQAVLSSQRQIAVTAHLKSKQLLLFAEWTLANICFNAGSVMLMLDQHWNIVKPEAHANIPEYNIKPLSRKSES